MPKQDNTMVHDPFRRVLEIRSALLWLASAAWAAASTIVLQNFIWPLVFMIVASLAMACLRAKQAYNLLEFRLGLCGKSVQVIPASTIIDLKDRLQNDMWLGWGYRLEPSHTQLMHRILALDNDQIYPPEWFRRLRRSTIDPLKVKGLPWMAGIGKEEDIFVPFKALEGHTAILATTGAIKTRLMALMILQCVLRGDPVMILDPKGDRELELIVKQVCDLVGKADKFLSFHPGRSRSSFRIDSLASFERATQVAARIRMIMSSKEDDNFVSYVVMTVTHITGCMRRIGIRPSFDSLLDHVQTFQTSEALLEKVLKKLFEELDQQVDSIVQARAQEIETERNEAKAKKGAKVEIPAFSTTRLQALVELFNTQVEQNQRPSEISGLIGALTANREWFGKMVVSLKPVLTKLTSGDLRDLLSPKYDDINDERPIMNTQKLIKGGYVAYIALDALTDASVAAATASSIMADAAATAGEIYNYSDEQDDPHSLHMFGDEFGDLLCEVVIPIVNKARGAGVKAYFAGQSQADASDALGSDVKAFRFFSNMNNLIVGATNDSGTLELISSKFREVTITTPSSSKGINQRTEDAGMEFGSTRSVSRTTSTVEMMPPSVIAALGDLQYVAVVNRAQCYYGRIPVVMTDASNDSRLKKAA